MRIERIEIHNEHYLELAQSHGSVFNDPKWLSLFGSELELYGIFELSRLRGAYFIHRSKKGPFQIIQTPQFTPGNGWIFDAVSINKSKQLSEIKNALSHCCRQLDSLPWNITSIAFPPEVTDMQPFRWNRFKTSVNYTYRIDLRAEWSVIENNMSPELRNVIKKAHKDNLTFNETGDTRLIFDLINKTFNRKELKTNFSVLNDILHKYSNDQNSFAFAAFQDGQPSAVAFCIFDNSKVYYLLGGYDPQNKHNGAGPACIKLCIEKAKKMGKQIFDFEGSMIPSVEKYFRSFGPELTPYFAVHKAWLPLEYILKLNKRDKF